MSVGDRIKKLRNEHGLKQTELAKKVNSSSQVISNWERGYTALSHDDVVRLADALDTSTAYLLGEIDDPHAIKNNEYNSLAEIKKIVDDLGIEDLFFHNIDDWKNLTKKDVEEIRDHFEYIAHKARQRKKEEN